MIWPFSLFRRLAPTAPHPAQTELLKWATLINNHITAPEYDVVKEGKISVYDISTYFTCANFKFRIGFLSYSDEINFGVEDLRLGGREVEYEISRAKYPDLARVFYTIKKTVESMEKIAKNIDAQAMLREFKDQAYARTMSTTVVPPKAIA